MRWATTPTASSGFRRCAESEVGVSYTVAELAARWNCHPQTIRRMIADGVLKAFRVGREWRVAEEVVKWIETRQLQPAA